MDMFILGMLLGIMIGLFISYAAQASKEPAADSSDGHIYPKYHGYKGGFDKVNVCTECGTLGLYEDFHSVNPCYKCGGKIKEGLVGKFNYSTKEWELKTAH